MKKPQEFYGLLNRYNEYLKDETEEVKNMLIGFSEGVLKLIEQISTDVKKQKEAAQLALESIYLKESQETHEFISSMQSEVDSILSGNFEGSSGFGKLDKPNGQESGQTDARLAGLFSKHMESLYSLEEVIENPLFKAIYTLSNDDIANQRIKASLDTLNANSQYLKIKTNGNLPIGVNAKGENFPLALFKSLYQQMSMVDQRQSFLSLLLKHFPHLNSEDIKKQLTA